MHTAHGIVLCSVLAATTMAQGPVQPTRPARIVSTTIDFLDYCFFRTDPAVGYFTEAQYDAVIRSLAQAGFAKVYLRVDVCGRTLYPSTAGTQYAGDGRDPGSTYLVNTLRRYDPAAKTIELGHRYGLEVWCWYAFLDDEGTVVHYGTDSDLGRRYGEYPLKDPFLVQNPHLQWRLDPQLEARQAAEAATAATAGPITAICVRSDVNQRNRIQAEDVLIYTSADNRVYQRYDGSFGLTVESEKPPTLVFDGFALGAHYVQMVLRTPQPADNSFTLAGAPGALVEVRYDDAWHPTMADYVENDNPPEQATFAFRGSGRFAWDYRRRRLGLAKAPAPLPRYYGVTDLSEPEARDHKLAKLRELARYDFDGFAHSIRTHSQSRDPSVYGYGQAIRDAYRERHGADIWREAFDRERWLALRGERLNEYVREAVRVLAPRPLFMDAPKAGSSYLLPYAGLPLQHEAWVTAGGVAGIRLLGYGPDEVLRPVLTTTLPARVVRFVDNSNVPAPAVFKARLERWLDEPGLDEVEFYETLLYTDDARYLTAVREALAARQLLPASAR